MAEIKVGDVFKHNKAKRYCAVIVSTDFFLREYHKIGHIDKFAEALKELEEIAKNS